MLVKNVYLPVKPFWGLGDFLRGCLSLRNICEEFGFSFEVDYSKHPISQFLENRHFTPLEVDPSEVNEFDHGDGPHVEHLFKQVSEMPEEDKKNTSLLLTTNLWRLAGGVSDATRTFMRESFEPSKELRDAVRKTQEGLGVECGKYSVLHIRMGDKFLVDGETDEEVFQRIHELILKGFKEHNVDVGSVVGPLLVLSDCLALKEYLHAKEGWLYTDVKPCHLSTDVKGDTVRDTMVDMCLLSEAESVFCISKHGYGSGFCDWTCDIYGVPCIRFENPDVAKDWDVNLFTSKPIDYDPIKLRKFTSNLFELGMESINPIINQYKDVYNSDKIYINEFPFNTYTVELTNRQGLYFIDNRDDIIKHHITYMKGWETNFIDDILTFCKPGSTALDIGAHIGTHTQVMSDGVGQNGKVYAFEPGKKIYRELCYNLAINDKVNVIPIRAAIGNTQGIISMNTTAGNEGNSMITFNTNQDDAACIIRLDDLKLNNVSYIKIDVEGEELNVINGAISTITNNRPVIFIEIWGNYIYEIYPNGKKHSQIIENRQTTIKRLESLNYSVKHIQGDDYLAFPNNTPPESNNTIGQIN